PRAADPRGAAGHRRVGAGQPADRRWARAHRALRRGDLRRDGRRRPPGDRPRQAHGRDRGARPAGSACGGRPSPPARARDGGATARAVESRAMSGARVTPVGEREVVSAGAVASGRRGWVAPIVAGALTLAAWEIVARVELVDPLFFAGPGAVAGALWRLVT